MKAFSIISMALLAAIACDRIISEPSVAPGILSLSFSPEETRACADLPDTNSFILNIRNHDGTTIWSGSYSQAPKELPLHPGEYTVEALSGNFTEPLFERPLFGDRQTVMIESDRVSAVHLRCTQKNASVRLQQTEQFMADYPAGTFYVQSSTGTLMYSYGERRTGYFMPGTIWIVLSWGGSSKTLAVKEISEAEVLVLRIGSGGTVLKVDTAAERYGDGLSMEVDTCRTWTWENYDYGAGGEGPGSVPQDMSGAYSIGQARNKADSGEKGVWVYGYIAGGDCTSKTCSFSAPFKSNSNIVLSPGPESAVRESCLAVQLRQGDIRDALNLVDHPELVGRMVYLKGDLVPKYYGLPGLQNISGYRMP